MEMAEMGHYGTVQILKRRIDKNDEARDGCRGPLDLSIYINTCAHCGISSV